MDDKGFYRHTHQSYARFDKCGNCVSLKDGKTESIVIGLYPEGGNQGTRGEFEIYWIPLGGVSASIVQVFDDAWKLFEEMSEFFKHLALMESSDPSPYEIESMLLTLGYFEIKH